MLKCVKKAGSFLKSFFGAGPAETESASILEKTESKTRLKLIRNWFDDSWTIGELFIGDNFECYTLEDTVRNQKISKVTAIPPGTYEVVISFSNKFKKFLPLLLNVPEFSGIRIHPGNVAKDTEGCILVGKRKHSGFISNSREAMSDLMTKLEDMVKKEKVFIEIVGGVPFDVK